METGIISPFRPRRSALRLALLLCLLAVPAQAVAQAAPKAVIVREQEVMRREPPPHGAIGMSTAYRISDAVPGRAMEFRRRVLHVGGAIGLHPIDHDEVYYVLGGEGDVTSDGVVTRLKPGDAAYLFRGAEVGIKQVGG